MASLAIEHRSYSLLHMTIDYIKDIVDEGGIKYSKKLFFANKFTVNQTIAMEP